MKMDEIKVKVTLNSVNHAPNAHAWEELCEWYGINEWCLNEGLAYGDDTVEVSFRHAKRWGLIEDETT